MKIGIITNFIDEEGGGIGTYTYNLIKNLNKVDQKNKYYLIHHTPMDLDIYNFNEEIIIPIAKLPFKKTIWRYFSTLLKLKSQELDIVHDPYEIGPLSFEIPFKGVITVYDLTALFPRWHVLINVVLHKLLLRRTLKKVNFIITVSNNTKQDLIKYFGVNSAKIRTIYLAADKNYKPIKKKKILERIRKKYCLPQQFILFVGTLEPRKNIVRLFRAYAKLCQKIKIPLVMTGKKGWKYKKIFETYKKLELEDKIIFTGYLEEEDLPAIYNLAEIFVYPSLYEGFGLPVLEAMACGCPVITSNTSSLPEVVGDAGIMIDPYDVDGFAEATERVLNDENLRKEMIKKGLKQAKKFSWEKTAKETLEVYEKIYDEK